MFKAIKTGIYSSRRPGWLDPLICVIAAVLFVGAVVLNYKNIAIPAFLVVIIKLGLVVLAVLILCLTRKGMALFSFSKESRLELKKVHWPTRQETIQVTLMVVAMVLLVGLFLWGVDGFFMWLVDKLTGQRG